jgi:Tfp pilus assembly protein PilF
MGSIEYQRGREAEGQRLFRSLPALPDEDGDLWQVINEAGDFLIQRENHAAGLEIFEAAVLRFPDRADLHQSLACCAAHQRQRDRAIAGYQRALELDPGRPDLTNDLGWSLFEAGRLEEAVEVLRRAVAMDPAYELARENLRHREATLARRKKKR